MKIVIVGGGIGGLTTYHALRKHLPPTTIIKLFEAYPSPASTTSVIGGGLGLAPNGQRVLDHIMPDAIQYIKENSCEHSIFTFRDERGRLLGRKDFGRGRYGYEQAMGARAVIHDSLLRNKADDDENLVWGRRVKSIKESAEKVILHFEQGPDEECDLLIGADGVRSAVRKSIFGDKYPPTYQGLTGIGGFLPLSAFPPSFQTGVKDDPITMTFSRSGFFGYSLILPPSTPISSQKIQWWSTFEVNPAPERDGMSISELKAELLNRHGGWKSPYDSRAEGFTLFKTIVEKACEDGVGQSPLVLPRYITARLPNWTSLYNAKRGGGRVILIGDAAHVMPPDSGQGVSCAAEDGLTLALLLAHYSAQTGASGGDVIKQTARAYEAIRIPRVNKILDYAKRGGDGKREMGWVGEKVRNAFLWVFCNVLPLSFMDSNFAYDVEKEVEKYLSGQR